MPQSHAFEAAPARGRIRTMTPSMKLLLPAMLIASFSLTACAQAPAPATDGTAASDAKPASRLDVDPASADGRAVDAIRKINPRVEVDAVGEAPIEGFREVIVSGQVLYVSDDGRYLLQGSLFDIEQRRDLSEVGLAKVRRALLAGVPESDRIVFGPPSPTHTVTVFTDIECGYCRKIHQEIDEYNRQGIAIQYVAFPRMGPASEDFRTMEAVWCAEDRRQALTDAKSGKTVPPRRCTNPVAMQYELGQRIGLTGTPLIIAEDGTQLPGYLPPTALRAALDDLAKNSTAEAAAGS